MFAAEIAIVYLLHRLFEGMADLHTYIGKFIMIKNKQHMRSK